jgi:lysophospholipase L1-like esterase
MLTPLSTVPSGVGPAESDRGSTDPGNTWPIAINDAFTVSEDSVANALSVLADNGGAGADYDPDGDPVTVVSATSPGSAGGSIAVNATSDGLEYTPVADFAGTESFDYGISDGRGGTATATVTVTVNNTNNDAPVLAPVGNRVVTEGQTLALVLTATDVDGAPVPAITANLTALSGSPAFSDLGNGTASFSWTPAVGDAPGPYSVTFTAVDAVNSALTSAETISIAVQAAGSGGGTGAYQPDAAGQVVIEAENFDLNVSQGGRDWIPDFTAGYVGDSAMLSDPDSWLSVDSNIASSSPRMDYQVEFAAPASLNVWLRGLGPSGSADSVWVGLNGDDATVLRINPTRGTWGWETSTTQLAVPAGVHTINVWMREDGTIVDRLLLTPASTVPSGNGPAESSREGGAPANNVPVAANDVFTVAEDSVSNALAVLDNNGAGPDYDPDGDPINVVSVTSPGSAGGSIVVDGSSDGVLYTPAANFAGPETFSYTIGDGRGGLATALVSVTVNNTNNDLPLLAPIGNHTATENQMISFVVTASDVDGPPVPTLTANLAQLSGSPVFIDNGNGSGSFSWTPASGDSPGPYAITFTAIDAVDSALTASETISIDVQAAGGGGSGAWQPDGSGQFVIEAEHFDLNVSQGGRNWVEDFTPGYVGDSAMLSDPNSWLSVSSNIATNSPRMDYEIELAAPANLNVWVRGLGPSGSADSLWVGYDGDDSTVVRINPTRGAWGWETAASQLSIPAGVHTINVWMREDGTIIDRLLLTPQSIVPTGDGPAESNRGDGGGGSGLPLSDDFSDGNSTGWSTSDDGIQFPSNWGVVNQAYVQTEWTNSSGKDVTETYHRGSYAFLDSTAGLDDYRLSVDIVPDEDSADDIGVMFRYANANNYYRFSLNSLNGFARLESNLNGSFITLAKNLRGYRPGILQNIVVEVEGPLIQVFLNGDPLFAARDTDHPNGGIALYSRDNSSFDNVSVTVPGSTPEVVLESPVAHSVIPNGPLDVTVTAVARNIPVTNGSVSVQYHTGGSPVLCQAAAEGPSGIFTALCPGMPAGDYTVEALLLDNGVEVDRDSNQSVGIGSVALNSHRYEALGDSITRGVGDNYAADNLNLFDQRTLSVSGWPALLGDLLTQATGAPNIVANEGIPGDRVVHTESQRLLSIIERNPDSNRTLVMLGTNDSNDFNTTSTTDLVADLQSIVDILRGNGRDTVYLSLLPPAWGGSLSTPYSDPLDPSASRNQTIITYNTAIQGMLPQTGVLLGPDLFSCFLTPTLNRFSLFEDSLHPNALGHAMIAALWRDAIVSGPVLPPVDPCPAPIYILESLDSYAFGHKQNLLEAGDRYYTDEAFTLTSVPAELADGVWVMQRNANNSNADSDYLSFDAGPSPVTVYIAFDPAGNPPTSSTDTFTPVSLSGNLTTSDPAVGTFSLVRATGVSGNVIIGGNKSGGSPAAQQGYLVIVAP